MSVAVLTEKPAAAEIAAAVNTTTATLPPKLTGLRGVLARRTFSPFHRLLVLALLVNAAVLSAFLLNHPSWTSALTVTITAASINMAITALMRQQYVVNLLFAAVTRAPLRWPLRVRTALAKVHHVGGGLHVGCAIAAIGWFAGFTAVLLISPITETTALHVASVSVALVIAIDLLVIALLARPSMRERRHNLFESSHRYGGWLALLLFGALTVLIAASGTGSIGDEIIASPNTWILVTILISALIPWLQLRRVPVEVFKPSNHVALVRFDHGKQPRTGSASKVARRPLGEWHAFANMTTPDQPGFQLAISRAGDWTSELIGDEPDHLWVRGVPTTGVGTVARLFTNVVWVATGSGIAPCLPHLLNDPTPARLVWVTRHPERTYGTELVGQILAAQPDAVLWNSDTNGKPDLVQLAYEAYLESGAEAVICISNKATTLRVVGELRQRGIPAFGPIWDS